MTVKYFPHVKDFYNVFYPLVGPVPDKYKNKSMFKDKKLNRLWEKAELSGFTGDELSKIKKQIKRSKFH